MRWTLKPSNDGSLSQGKRRMLSDYIVALLRDAWPTVVTALERPWEAPTTAAHEIQALLQSSGDWTDAILQRVEVAGSPDHYILCIQCNDQLIFCSACKDTSLKSHPFIRELVEKFDVQFYEYDLPADGICLTAPLTTPLQARLTLPSVLLTSLFHSDMYPAARLTLGISYLASYLRRYHLASVELMDCQLGINVSDIVARVKQTRPVILGVSVNFGQFDLMKQLLDCIYDPTNVSEPPIVILGNILPAMCHLEILKVYPQVVICRKEGELSLAALVKYGSDRSRWNQIPDIYYYDKQGRLITTPPRYLPLENLPPPALDTVSQLFEQDGVITAEFSRGCQYNQCSFCPRTHKGGLWRTIPIEAMQQHWQVFAQVFKHFGRIPHVFLADEDFVGSDNGEATIQRITTFLDRAHAQNLQITFDASCRADQIFRADRDQLWHLSRGNLFKHAKEKGLSRLFVGVESGAPAQLLRYKKGSTVGEMISAIRYLSLLGIQLRFGFIFFDPLMSVQDLIENVEFLGRKDIILPTALPSTPVEEIFALVSSNHEQEMHSMSGRAVFEEVSYMVSPLEVLAKSRYLFDLRGQAPQLMNEQLDVSFARYSTSHKIPEIGLISKACQYWVNYCFPIVYALKGLQKIAQREEKALLRQAISKHRHMGYMLIRGLAEVFSLVDDATLHHWEKMHTGLPGSESLYAIARSKMQEGQIDEAISSVLVWYGAQIQLIMEEVNTHLSVLSASKQAIWQTAYNSWIASPLSEAHALRIT
jgi:radical SAM superfamily enzyme YgiQ (UPF0313 family)